MKAKTLMNKIKKINYRHFVAIAITIIFLCISIFVFPNAFVRIIEAFKDIWNSICYYIKEIFRLDWKIQPTVTTKSNVSFAPLFNFPSTWEEFIVMWNKYWIIFVTTENLQAYISYLGKMLYNFSRILLLIIIPLVLILYLVFQKYLRSENNDYNVDSKPLRFIKWLANYTYIPVKNWVKGFVSFIKENNKYFKIWLFIWAFNFNLITIIIEFIAFYLYFVISFDFKSMYVQFYKLSVDVSVPFSFIPPFAWCVLVYLFICWLRKKIGFINERPIVLMVVGTMGKKKTTAITDIALSQETMLRDKALDKLIENDMKFSNFPWINLENAIKYAMSKHMIYNLATIRKYIKHLSFCFYVQKEDKAIYKSIKRHLKRRFNLHFDNLCFDYDFERYGLYYDDKLKVVDVWHIIETYAQLYFVYIIQSSLIISNYSLRSDNMFLSVGNFPMWDTDFFKRDSKMIDMTSRHAHIIDFDALRLGQKIIKENPKKDSFEFGVVTITEVGKERKNNLELQEKKKKDDVANQKNDGFNDWLKMIRHSATIDNYPFVKVITDEQRPESWGADARDLCEIVHIKETSEMKLAMPFFAVTELFYSFIYNKFIGLYNRYRYNRSDNTLFMYGFKKIASILNNFYSRTYNTFGYCKLDVCVEDGTQDGQLNDKKYYLMSKKIYSKRFSTDCFSEFFTTKSLRSAVGLNDLQEYETEKATFDELRQQNSYFINDLTNKESAENKKLTDTEE